MNTVVKIVSAVIHVEINTAGGNTAARVLGTALGSRTAKALRLTYYYAKR